MYCRIMRGLPGSGKSSSIDRVNSLVCSADDFQIDDGKYNFKPERAKEAHLKCYREFIRGVQNQHPYIVVDNTNTDPIEIAPYYRYAEAFCYDVVICFMNTPIEICIQRQTHGVPLSTMIHMAFNLKKPLPKFWRMEERDGTLPPTSLRVDSLL